MNEDGKISESRGSITSFEGAETFVNMSNVATLLHELDKRVVVWRDFVMLRRHLANHVGRVKNVHNVGSKQEEIKVLVESGIILSIVVPAERRAARARSSAFNDICVEIRHGTVVKSSVESTHVLVHGSIRAMLVVVLVKDGVVLADADHLGTHIEPVSKHHRCDTSTEKE